MSVNQRSDIRFRISVLALLICLPVVGFIAFNRGVERGHKNAQVSSANDSAFYCLSGLRAIDEQEEDRKKFKLLLQISLDGEAVRLSELCIAHPEWIGRTNYNLLKSIDRYLAEHQGEREGLTALRPVAQVASKVSQALTKLETHHDIREWKNK